MLEGLTPEELECGIDLTIFTHLAQHNKASIQTFFYPHEFDASLRLNKQGDTLCEKGCLVNYFRKGSFPTFRTCVQALCRRSQIYLILNQSRKLLNQTGDGHYMPVGGFHEQLESVFMFDVARFKYPPYWCSLK